ECESAGHAAGVRRASAPIVALAENHSFPEPGWAAALIQAHRAAPSRAAVGPELGNANPERAVSWAYLFSYFGRWAEPAAAGIVEVLPGHNPSNKRDILLA